MDLQNLYSTTKKKIKAQRAHTWRNPKKHIPFFQFAAVIYSLDEVLSLNRDTTDSSVIYT